MIVKRAETGVQYQIQIDGTFTYKMNFDSFFKKNC